MSNTNHPDWKIKTRNVFVILFQDDKKFFLNDTTRNSLWKVYDEHYRENHACTKALFAEYKKQMKLPGFFVLETIEGTNADGFQRCVIWSKYFIEHGYACLAGPQMLGFVERLDTDDEELYQSIKNISLEEICSEDKNLFPDFKQKKSKKPAEKSNRKNCVRLELVLQKSEYDKFKKIADKYGISMTEFFLYCARHGGVINIDLSFIDQYIRRIEDFSNTLDAIASTILLSRDYSPADLERMHELSESVMESNGEVKIEIMQLIRKIRRMNNW